MRMRDIAVLIGVFATAACATGAPKTAAPRPSIATVPVPQVPVPKDVTVVAPPESDGASVIGQRAGSLTKRFGLARIDLKEGEARKLQFAGQSCVLDVYLYPVAAGTEPVATHVDARLRSNGATIDKAACIAEVETR
jgi:hypothetical protein